MLVLFNFCGAIVIHPSAFWCC